MHDWSAHRRPETALQTSRPSGKDASLDDYALYTSGYDEGGESYLNPQTGAALHLSGGGSSKPMRIRTWRLRTACLLFSVPLSRPGSNVCRKFSLQRTLKSHSLRRDYGLATCRISGRRLR